MRARLGLLPIGVISALAGLRVTTNTQQINEGNQCGASGCNNASASVPSVVRGMAIFIIGFVIAVYGLRKCEGDED